MYSAITSVYGLQSMLQNSDPKKLPLVCVPLVLRAVVKRQTADESMGALIVRLTLKKSYFLSFIAVMCVTSTRPSH